MFGKDFQKGMEAGTKPYEAKYQQYAEAFDRLKGEFAQNWETTKKAVDGILDHLDDRQKKNCMETTHRLTLKIWLILKRKFLLQYFLH
jgi:hypothetical protein